MLQFKAWFKSLLRKHWYLLVICFLCIILSITLYDTSNQVVSWEPEPADSSSLRVGFSQIETDNPWRIAQINSFHEVLIPNGMDFIYHKPEDFSVQQQLEDMHRLIREGVDYLVIVPANLSALIPILQDAKDAGIPIISIDQSAETIDQSYYVPPISADYLKEGQICTGLLADKSANRPCSIVEIYGAESSPGAQACSKGSYQALMQHPNTEIIDVEYGNSNRVTAQKTMGNVLIKAANYDQTIGAVFAHSDEDGLGILQAIEVAGPPPRRISIAPINGIQDVYEVIITGEYLGTVGSNPRWGFIAASLTQQMKRDCKPSPMVMIPHQTIATKNTAECAFTAY